MQILPEILLQYIYNHNQFYILYCHEFGELSFVKCMEIILRYMKLKDI